MERKPITVADILNTPGIILGFAALIFIIGAIAPWYSAKGISASGWDVYGGKLTVFIALMMLGTATVSMGYIRSPALERAFPILSVSVVCGLITLVGCLIVHDVVHTILPTANPTWGLYLTVIGALISLFAGYRAYILGIRKAPSGL